MRRRDFIKTMGVAAGASAIPFLKFLPAEAAGRGDTLVVVTGNGPNSMDIQRKGTNRPSYQIAVNLYDRLVGYGTKTLEDGTMMYDYQTLEPELAESWEVAADGMSITFKIRKGATFWDGMPITAHDVKWSFDRAVSLGGFPTVQMKAGSLEKPEQFEAVDDSTFVIKLLRKSKLTLPDLGVPVPIIFNSKVAKANATADDPWATEYLHRTPAGGGAFMLERWDPGQQTVYKRYDDWKNGDLPGVKRVIIREVPSASTRRALLERGDADVSLDLPPKDFAELKKSGKFTINAAPIENSLAAIGLNLTFEPFKKKEVRQAIAYSVPYDQIFKQAAFERGIPMWGGKSFSPETIEWPQPFPYDTDYDKAKALLKEAGYADGFEVPLSFNLGLAQWSEPMCLLLQESLAKVGIKATIDKIPGANWRTAALVEKKLPMHIKNFGGWLNYPDYYSFWVYQKGRLFNSMNYHNEEVEKITDETLHLEVDHPDYEPNIKKLLSIFFDEVPLIPVYQPYLDVATQKSVTGYEYYFHRQLDCRSFKKATA
ncbi:MAG: ABC transporter substrate-binding protein [Rhodospirillales bacterium]|nr:ABC transporter substrate-binding protein [Rhodospirillales bacterium]